jgi:FkbM family methyltransferase
MLIDLKKLKKKYSLDIQGVIHVGAHRGEEHKVYKEMNIKNIVYFEALPHIFEKLIANVKDPDAIFHNCALGNKKGKIGMHVEENDRYGCSSILLPSKNYDRVPFLDKKIVVEINKLDNFNYNKDYNMLNIDVQGYELEVLKGSSNTLKHIDYIMCEINRSTEKKGIEYINCALVEELQEFLLSYGFELVEQNWAGTSWGDGFFIKTKLY